MENTIMTTLETERQRDTQREIIRQSVSDIIQEIEISLRDAGLTDPIFMTVPSNGLSLITIATPLDPPHEKWNRMVDIARKIVGERLGISLSSRDLLCAAANTAMSATELTIDPIRQ
jgi:hypothetical protein